MYCLLEGQSNGHVVRRVVCHELGGYDRATPPEDGLSGIGILPADEKNTVHTSTSAGVVPFTRPATCTTLPLAAVLAPLILIPPSAVASLIARWTRLESGLRGAAAEAESREERDGLSGSSYKSWDQGASESPFGGRVGRT